MTARDRQEILAKEQSLPEQKLPGQTPQEQRPLEQRQPEQKLLEQRLLRQMAEYKPFNEQEERDRRIMMDFLENGSSPFTRENEMAHFTASGWIVNRERTKVLMVYHNIYHSWSWIGGHADGERDLLAVALREGREETGHPHLHPVSEEIFSLEIITVDGHEKRGRYVPSHLHMNVTYLLEGDEEEGLHIKADENSGVAWIPLEELPEKVTEPWMLERIYAKCNRRLKG